MPKDIPAHHLMPEDIGRQVARDGEELGGLSDYGIMRSPRGFPVAVKVFTQNGIRVLHTSDRITIR